MKKNMAWVFSRWFRVGQHDVRPTGMGRPFPLMIAVVVCGLMGFVATPAWAQCSSPITVSNNTDSDPGSLRQAITDVCPSGTITFNGDYTIPLASQLTIDKNMTIDGTGHSVTVDGQNNVRVFYVNSGVTATLSYLTIINGNAGTGNGGGINNSGTLTVMNSTLSSNNATWGGGIYNSSTLTVTNSTLANNRITAPFLNGGGGGIYNGGTLTVQNSTLGNNSAPSNTGGGIYNYNNGDLTVRSSTLSGNSADYGSGLWNDQTGSTFLSQTIIANSSSGHDCNSYNNNAVTAVDSLIEGDNCGVSSDYNTILGKDPLLGSLADYGGSTQLFALLPGSPAIAAVTSTPCLATDQRGVVRPDTACDIGAFESQGFTLTKTGGDNQSTLINTAFANPLTLTMTANDAGVSLDGEQITFTPPASGASAVITGSPATVSSGAVSVTATANDTVGSYTVTASATGATSVDFTLTNLAPTPTPTITPEPTVTPTATPTPEPTVTTTPTPTQSYLLWTK